MPRRRNDLVRAGWAVRTGGSAGQITANPMGNEWFYKAADLGGKRGGGKNPDTPHDDMSEIFGQIGRGDTIHIWGGVYANLEAPRIADVSIVGVANRPRHDKVADTDLAQPEKGASAWRTASGVTEVPLLELRGQGWRLCNFLMVGPSGSCSIWGKRTAEDDNQEDASHAELLGMRFIGGEQAILQSGGMSFVRIAEGTRFKGATVAAIGSEVGAGIDFPREWELDGVKFVPDDEGSGNASHIIAAAKNWEIKNSLFGKVTSTGKYIDFTGGATNVVGPNNFLMGLYDTTDYVSATGDNWYGNRVVVKATTAPDGVTIQVPGA